MRDRSASHKSALMLSIPAMMKLGDPFSSLNETSWERVFIMLNDPSNKDDIQSLIFDFKDSFTTSQLSNIKFFNYFDSSDTNDEVTSILDTIFNVIIAITMFLCFFSLCSSMSANLMDQTKEIGILRAMGFTKTRMKVLYFYEAFILVIASCLLGVVIGVIVGFTMVL